MSSTLRSRALAAGAVAVAGGAAFVGIGAASPSSGTDLAPVATANPRAAGVVTPDRLSGGLQQVTWAQGATALENPAGIVTHYGYENDVPSADDAALPQTLPTPASATEAQKTEPDKNTYLALRHPVSGPDPHYDYGTHVLFQGHEGAAHDARDRPLGYLTRINLDADAAHRVTLMATEDTDGRPLSTIDGSTWDPFARRLLLTTESPDEPTYAATAGYPSTVQDVSGALGRGGYEGIQDDSAGDVWIVEDVGGDAKGGTKAKRPNSFVYRYVPRHRGDLEHGRLQALQVRNESGQPITFASQAAVNAPDQVLLHSYGHALRTRWVTVHDTATDGTAPFDANAAAKAADATPFKRPENGLFRPGSTFGEFYFDETGDTNADSVENQAVPGGGSAGGWGGIQRLVQRSPSASTGRLELFYAGDEAHTGLDNTAFLSRDRITFVEDAGDGLHGQRDALDSGFVFDVRRDYGEPGTAPVRWLAEGRDASATIDAANDGFGKNDGDNEITGVHVSDGDPTAAGILGAKVPRLFDGWRWFWTRQHGDNVTSEVIPAPPSAGDHEDAAGAGR